MTSMKRVLGRVRTIGSAFVSLAVVGILLAWLGGAFGARINTEKAVVDLTGAPASELTSVKRCPVEETITAIGTVQPRRKVDVASQITASLLEMKVQPGDRVQTDDILAVLDDRELVAQQGEALASITASEADVDLRQREYDRITRLMKDAPGATTREEIDRITGAYNHSQALLKRARQQLARIEVQLTYTKIRASSPGVIADRFADPGNLAVPGKPLLAVHDTRKLELHVSVPETQALHVRVGQRLTLQIDAANLSGVGIVREIVPLAQQASRSVLAKVSLPVDLSVPVYTGMFGRVTLPVGLSTRLLIPQAAVRQVGQLELVDVAGTDGMLRRRFVRTGRSFKDQVEILSGLNEGERVALPR